MKPDFFGDSYDLVKRSLLVWLEPLGQWHVHPMFVTDYPQEFVEQFQHLIGVPLITTTPVPARPHRQNHIQLANKFHNVLFDPDTGLKIEGVGGAPKRFLCLAELIAAAHARPHALTAVFDQSLSRGEALAQLQAKVDTLHDAGLGAFAYYSHACFVFASCDTAVVEQALHLLIDAGIPATRMLRSQGSGVLRQDKVSRNFLYG